MLELFILGGFIALVLRGSNDHQTNNQQSAHTHQPYQFDSKATNDYDRTRDIDLKAHWRRQAEEKNDNHYNY